MRNGQLKIQKQGEWKQKKGEAAQKHYVIKEDKESGYSSFFCQSIRLFCNRSHLQPALAKPSHVHMGAIHTRYILCRAKNGAARTRYIVKIHIQLKPSFKNR